MSATVSTTPRAPQQRATEAIKHLSEALDLKDGKLLSAALAEVSVEEVNRNQGFVSRIKATYQDLESVQAALRSRSGTRVVEEVELVPLPGMERPRYDPFAPLDPYFLQRVYGNKQLRAALNGYSLVKLKQAVALVEQQHRGTKPKNRGRIDDTINYIVEHVAGDGY